MSFWQTFYEMGVMPEDYLRRACERELFLGRPGREYWKHARATRPLYTSDRRARRFDEIVEDEYARAIARNPDIMAPATGAGKPGAVPRRGGFQAGKVAGGFVIAAAAGALIDRAVSRRK